MWPNEAQMITQIRDAETNLNQNSIWMIDFAFVFNHALLQLCLLQHLQALIEISTDRSRTTGHGHRRWLVYHCLFLPPLFFSNSVTLFLCLVENPSAGGGIHPGSGDTEGRLLNTAVIAKTTEIALAHRKSFQTYLLITHIYVHMSSTVSLWMQDPGMHIEALLKNKAGKMEHQWACSSFNQLQIIRTLQDLCLSSMLNSQLIRGDSKFYLSGSLDWKGWLLSAVCLCSMISHGVLHMFCPLEDSKQTYFNRVR